MTNVDTAPKDKDAANRKSTTKQDIVKSVSSMGASKRKSNQRPALASLGS